MKEIMKEYLFRGKRKDNGKWAYGYYYAECGNTYIIENRQKKSLLCRNQPHLVIPKTVGQFTGLTDKNGKKIFEDDIIIVYENINGKTKSWSNIVCFKNACFSLYDPNCCEICKNGFGITCLLDEASYFGEIEVIDNIHNNPELKP